MPARLRRPPRRAADTDPPGPMSGDLFWTAVGLVLVFEGLFPLLAPGGWRRAFQRLVQLRDGQLRFFGLLSVGFGLLVLALLAG